MAHTEYLQSEKFSKIPTSYFKNVSIEVGKARNYSIIVKFAHKHL